MRTIRSVFSFHILALVSCACAFGDLIPVVNVSLSADTPSGGVQEIAITNETGLTNGCNSYYEVCDNLAIQNWTLTVDYTSTYYNGAGPSIASPFVAQWQSSGDNILPAGTEAFDFDLCGSESVPDCASPTTVISEIDFSGTLNQNSFAIYDPNANGGSGGPGPTFYANPVFSLAFLPSAAFPGDYFESQDGFVGDATTGSSSPEPGTTLLLLGGFAVLGLLRRHV